MKAVQVLRIPLLAVAFILASLANVEAVSAMGIDAGTIDFEFDSYSVKEGGTTTITVVRNGGLEGEITAQILGIGGVAGPNGVDFNTSPNSFTFADGERSKTVTLTGTVDTLNEGDETYTMRVTGKDKNGDPAGSGDMVITVNDAGFAPGTIDFEFDSYTVDEGGTTTITIVRTGGTDGEISASLVGAGGGDAGPNGLDFNTSPNTFTFTDGETTKTVTLTGVVDTLNEGEETYNFLVFGTDVNGDQVGGGQTTFTVNDAGFSPGTIDFEFDSYTVDEGGTTTITIVRTGGTDGEISASLVGAGGGDAGPNGLDFNTSPNTFTFTDGQTTTTITLTGTVDALAEGLETYNMFVFGTDVNGDQVGGGNTTINVLDSAYAPGTIDFEFDSYSVAEGGTAVLTLVRTGGTDGQIRIQLSSGGGSATPGDDFTIPAQDLTMADGEATIDIDVETLSDALIESTEAFTFRFQARDLNNDDATGNSDETTLSIEDATSDLTSAFVPVTPCAVFDTRFGTGFGNPANGQQTLTVQTSGALSATQTNQQCAFDGVVPDNATAVMVNVVAISPQIPGNLRIAAAGQQASGGVVNFGPGTSGSGTNSNAVPVELSADGQLDVTINAATGVAATHVRLVILGYYE